jgi:hypothetical protein
MRGALGAALTCWLACSTQAVAAPLGGAAGVELPILRLVFGFVLCIILAGAAALALRRMGGGRVLLNMKTAFLAPVDREVRVCEQQRLSAHAEIVRLHWSGSDYLVVVSAGGASLIDKRNTKAPAP